MVLFVMGHGKMILLIVVPLLQCWGSIGCHWLPAQHNMQFDNVASCEQFATKKFGPNVDERWGCFLMSERKDDDGKIKNR